MESLVNTQQEVIAQTKMQLHFLRNNIKESQQNIHSMRKVLKSSRNRQCWTVGPIFTFGRSRMFGPDKLRPLAVGRSRSRRIKKP